LGTVESGDVRTCFLENLSSTSNTGTTGKLLEMKDFIPYRRPAESELHCTSPRYRNTAKRDRLET
jgi:hypothetical protein